MCNQTPSYSTIAPNVDDQSEWCNCFDNKHKFRSDVTLTKWPPLDIRTIPVKMAIFQSYEAISFTCCHMTNSMLQVWSIIIIACPLGQRLIPQSLMPDGHLGPQWPQFNRIPLCSSLPQRGRCLVQSIDRIPVHSNCPCNYLHKGGLHSFTQR